MARRRRRATRGCLGAPGVNLLLCSERVDHAACDALTRRGVFVAELVPEEDIRSTLDGVRRRRARDGRDGRRARHVRRRRGGDVRRTAPARRARARALYTFGRGERTRRWSEDRARRRSAHHKRLVERGLRVFAASLDRVEDETNGDGEDDARVSLVPGCAAFEAAMCARLRDAVDDARAGVDATSDEKSSFDDEGVDREARVMALEVTRDVSRGARAVGAEHGGARENVPRGDGDGGGSGDRSTMVGWEFRLRRDANVRSNERETPA